MDHLTCPIYLNSIKKPKGSTWILKAMAIAGKKNRPEGHILNAFSKAFLEEFLELFEVPSILLAALCFHFLEFVQF